MSRSSDTGGRWGRITRFRWPSAVMAGLRGLSGKQVVAGLLLLVMAAFVIGGLLRTRVQTGLDSFLPASDPSVADLHDVSTAFGGDPIVVLLEDQKPRDLFREKQLMTLIGLEGRLSHLPDVATVYGPGTLLNQIAAQAQNFVAELIGRRDGDSNRALTAARAEGKSEAEAQAAKQAVLDEFNVRYGPLIIQGLPSGLPTLRNSAFVNRVVFEADGPKSQWQFVVPSNDSVAILVRPREDADAGAVQRLVESVKGAVASAKLPTSKVTVSGVPAVVSALSAQAKSEGPLLGGVALLAVGLCFWFIPWTRRSRRLIPLGTTMVAIAITLAIFGWLHRPLSIGVVAFLSVVLGIGCYYPTYFAVRARVRTVLTVAGASAASLGTLVLSPLPLVRDLGLTLSIGIMLAALLGVLARRLVYRGDLEADSEDEASEVVDERDTGAVPLRAMLGRRGPLAAFAGALLIAAIGWGLLPSLPLETNVEQFAAGTPALADAKHIENAIGSSGQLDVVLDGPDATSPEAVDWMTKAEEVIITQYGDQAHRVVSLPMLLSFLGRGATPDEIQSAMRVLPQYLTGAVLSLDRGTSVMIYGVKVDDLAGTQKLAAGLREKLPPPPHGFTVKLAGLPIVAARGQELVSQDRLAANLLGVLAAGAVLALGLRRRWDAARAVVAALLATGAGLFLLWMTGTALSPITVALGSLTAAVGCEFTVLLSEAGRRRNQALRRAVLLVTATSVVGYAVLVISGIAVVREFGLLLAGAVLLALLASLCVVRLTAGPGAPDGESGNTDQPKQNSLQGAH